MCVRKILTKNAKSIAERGLIKNNYIFKKIYVSRVLLIIKLN